MKIVAFDDFSVGVVAGDDVEDVTPLQADVDPSLRLPQLPVELASRHDELRERLETADGARVSLDSGRLRSARPAPRNLLAQPLSYSIPTGTPARVGEIRPGDEGVVASPQIDEIRLTATQWGW